MKRMGGVKRLRWMGSREKQRHRVGKPQVFVICGASPSDWSRSSYKKCREGKGGRWRFDWSSKDLEAKLKSCNLTKLL